MKNNLQERLQELKKESASQLPSQATEQPVMQEVRDPIFSFVNPTELIDLPSKGQFYSDGHPAKGKESLEIKQMTAKEEDILTNKSFLKKGVLIDRLLESLLCDKSVPVGSLLVGDRNALMIAARATAYGAEYPVGILCQECGSKSEQVVDLSAATVMDAQKIEEMSEQNPRFKHARTSSGNVVIELPRTKWLVECRLLTGDDERKLLTFLEAKRKKEPTAELALSEQLMMIIDSINAVYDIEKIKEAIKIMPAGDAKHLRDVYQKLVPNIKLEKKYTCGSCGSEQEVEVPFTQEFFWPK